MNMRRICIAGLMAVTLNAWAAGSAPASAGKTKLDVTGTWNAKVEGGRVPMTYAFVFAQDKDNLTGTMSTNGAAPVAISNAKVYKTKITFQVEMEMPAMPQRAGMPAAPANQPAAPMKIVTKYEATVDGDTMTVEPQMGGGGMGGGMPMGGGGGGGMGGGGMGGGGGGGGMGGPPPGGGGGGGMGAPPAGGGGGMPGGMRGMGGMEKIVATRAK